MGTRQQPAASFAPRRVACLQPSASTTLARLGLLDRVVACTRWCVDLSPELADRVIVADSWQAECEQILAARPDLVIASVPYQLEAVAEILKAGIRFLALAPRTLDDVYADIVAVAGLVGRGEAGERLVAGMQAEVESVRQRVPAGAPPVRVYCEEWGKPLIHSQAWVAELIAACGGEFLGRPGKQTDAATVLRAAPDVIIAAWCGAGDRVPLEKIVRERRWAGTPAAQNARVFCIADELLNTPGPTLTGGLHTLAHALHPGLFPAVAGVRRIAAP